MLNNNSTMPTIQDFVSTACIHVLEMTHVRKKYAVIVRIDIIPCCTLIGNFNQLMTKGQYPIVP